MFRNACECITVCLVFQDVVQLPELQNRKQHHGSESKNPRMYDIGAHTAEVLRQVEGAGLQQGAWVGGDARFGSIPTVFECFCRFGVYSTFVVKNNVHLFPMAALHAVLKARF